MDSECTHIGEAIFQFSAKTVGGNRVFCIFCVFLRIFTQPCQIWLFSRVFGPFLPSEMTMNIIGGEYGSILACTFFGFLHFLPFLGIFGHFLHFAGFSGGWGVLGVLQGYKTTRGIKLVVGMVNDWI